MILPAYLQGVNSGTRPLVSTLNFLISTGSEAFHAQPALFVPQSPCGNNEKLHGRKVSPFGAKVSCAVEGTFRFGLPQTTRVVSDSLLLSILSSLRHLFSFNNCLRLRVHTCNSFPCHSLESKNTLPTWLLPSTLWVLRTSTSLRPRSPGAPTCSVASPALEVLSIAISKERATCKD